MDFSVFKISIKKVKYFIHSYLLPTFHILLHQKDLNMIKQLHNKHFGPAVIIANGKTAKIFLNDENLPSEISQATLFGVNDYLLHTSNKKDLHFYTLADPLYFMTHLTIEETSKYEDKDLKMNAEEWEILRTDISKLFKFLNEKKMTCFYPYTYNIETIKSTFPNINFVAFAGSTSYISKNYHNPRRVTGTPPMVAYMSIVIAHYLGFNPIYITGFDNNAFQSLERIIGTSKFKYNYSHWYDNQREPYFKVTSDSVDEILLHAAVIHRQHKKISKTINIVDLNHETLNFNG